MGSEGTHAELSAHLSPGGRIAHLRSSSQVGDAGAGTPDENADTDGAEGNVGTLVTFCSGRSSGMLSG